jgi:hypothetical protein
MFGILSGGDGFTPCQHEGQRSSGSDASNRGADLVVVEVKEVEGGAVGGEAVDKLGPRGW